MESSPPDYEESTNPMFSFRLLQSKHTAGPRLGRLVCRNVQIDTPAFIAPTSRGVVPHLSHDNLRDHTDIRGVYAALEDCVSPPSFPHLRVLTLRSCRKRHPPVPSVQTPGPSPYIHQPPLKLPLLPCPPPLSARRCASYKYRPFNHHPHLGRLP